MLRSDKRIGSTTQSPTLWSEQPMNVHWCLLVPKGRLLNSFFCKNNNGVGPVTFCHRYNLSKGDSVVPKLADIRSLQLAFKRTTSCAPRSTWIKYDGTVKVGSWFPNMVECRFSWSQSSWARWSRDLRPWIEANSNGPWMKVSRCEILSHLRNGTNLWWVAYEAEESNGRIRFVSDAGCGDWMSNKSWYWSQYLWLMAL